MVALGGVEGELAGVGVDDADVQVLDQEQDACSGVGAADADVVELPLMPEGDEAGVVDPVGIEIDAGGAASALGKARSHRSSLQGGPSCRSRQRAAAVIRGRSWITPK